jgi:hypothetical protein
LQGANALAAGMHTLSIPGLAGRFAAFLGAHVGFFRTTPWIGPR